VKKKCAIKRRKDQWRDVILRLYGRRFDTASITEALGVQPALTSTRGYIKAKSGKRYFHPYTQWILSPRVHRGASIETRVHEILKLIAGKEDALRRVLKNKGVRAELSIAVLPGEDVTRWSLLLPSELTRKFTDLGIDVRVWVHLF